MERLIFHVDVNSAFLSWEAARRVKEGLPDLREIPSCIGGDPKSRRGIVVAKSIPAKKYGVTTGEPVSMALRKCPELVCVPGDFALFETCSRAFKKICASYAPVMESFSIDEVFLDMSGTEKIYPDPVKLACEIKDRIREELGFTVNIGIAPNKLLAKMASDFTKPDRIHTLFPDEIAQKMWPLPVDDLYMVGHSSAARLKALGIRTIGELAATDPDYLRQEFKSHGTLMWEYANGIGDDHVHSTRREAKGIGNSTTLKEDARTLADAKKVLLSLSESVSMRLRKEKMLAQSITVEIRYHDFTNTSHQCGLLSATNTTDALYKTAVSLFQQLWNKEPVRLLGIRTSRLLPEDAPVQLSIFDYAADSSASAMISTESTASGSPLPDGNKKSCTQMPSANKQKQLDAAIDSIRKRFGSKALVRGSFLPSPESDPKKNHPSD